MRLNTMVSNVLDMARLQSGTVRLRREWQPLEEVVGASLRHSEAAIGGHQVELQLPADLPLLHIDAVLMERVLSNLTGERCQVFTDRKPHSARRAR